MRRHALPSVSSSTASPQSTAPPAPRKRSRDAAHPQRVDGEFHLSDALLLDANDGQDAAAAVGALAAGSDSSGDEGETGRELRYKNRIGRVPVSWYADFPHIGYDVSGKRLLRQSGGLSGIDGFLSRLSEPAAARTVYDAVNDELVELSADELRALQRLRHGGYAHLSFDPYADYSHSAFTSEPRLEAVGNAQEPKRRFIPSRWEAARVVKLVQAMRNGWIRPTEEVEAERHRRREEAHSAFLLWGSDGQVLAEAGEQRTGLHRMPASVPPPKLALPGHAHSYNPPAEYLLSEEEERQWQQADTADRQLDFAPRRFASMREIPAFPAAVRDRFERCLDLFLCPRRTRSGRLDIDPASLIPALPKPSELRPFPTSCLLSFTGHTARVRCLSVSPSGQWLASGAEDGSVRLWEVSTARCFRVWQLAAAGQAVVEQVAFCPDARLPLLAVCLSRFVLLLPTGLGSAEEEQAVDAIVTRQTPPDREQEDASQQTAGDDGDGSRDGQRGKGSEAQWSVRRERGGHVRGLQLSSAGESKEQEEQEEAAGQEEEREAGRRVLVVECGGSAVTHLCWHGGGDYFSTVSSLSSASSRLLIHRLSARRSQSPFSRQKGRVSASCFHPSQPLLFVATRASVLCYHLVKQTLLKRLTAPVRLISALRLHPSGDHLLVASFDRRVCWFDLDGASTPFRSMRYHTRAVRDLAFHPRFPLFASVADDGCAHVFHASVYADLMTDPRILPVKIIRQAHEPDEEGVAITAAAFHPTLPALFTAGADRCLRLFI